MKIPYIIIEKVMNVISGIKWPRLQALINGGVYWVLTEEDHDNLRQMLKPNYYFILTRRKCHLTTYLVSLISFFRSGKFSHYSHALMNVDNGKAQKDRDYKFIEATSIGVHFSTFMEIFDCDSVALIKPKIITAEDWVKIIDKALSDNGKEYDDIFDLTEDKRLSCVELCRDALKVLPNYNQDFAEFENTIKLYGNNLTPQMIYDCSNFEVVLEIRR